MTQIQQQINGLSNQENGSLDLSDGTKSHVTHINNMWVPGQPLPNQDPSKAEINLSIDWITCTFKNTSIIEKLNDLKPLEQADLHALEQESEENQYSKYGLRESDTPVKFWNKTYDWFEGAKVSVGMKGGDKDLLNKNHMVMMNLPGKALLHLRKKFGISSIETLVWIHSNMYDKEFHDNIGHFTRVDYAVDVLPKDSGFSLIESSLIHINANAYTTTAKNGGNIKQIFEKTKEGNQLETIYIGSRKSATFARIYDKRREQISSGQKDPGEEWHRFELETKQERAHKVAEKIIESHTDGDRWTTPLLGVIKKYINFKDLNESVTLTRLKNASTTFWWNYILENSNITELTSVSSEPKPLEERRKIWFSQIKKRLAKLILSISSTEEDTQQITSSLLEEGFRNLTRDELQELADLFESNENGSLFDHLERAQNALWGLKILDYKTNRIRA